MAKLCLNANIKSWSGIHFDIKAMFLIYTVLLILVNILGDYQCCMTVSIIIMPFGIAIFQNMEPLDMWLKYKPFSERKGKIL